MNTYHLLRQIHFYSAAFTASFLLLFFITGYLLGKHGWFEDDLNETTKQSFEVKVPEELTGMELARWAKTATQLTGKIDWINEEPAGKWIIEIVTPRMIHTVVVPPERDRLSAESRHANGYDTITTLHRMHGYGGGLLYDFYLIGMDLASLSLLLFSVTGIFLWLKLVRIQWLGWTALLLGLAYTGLVIFSWLAG